ncbi:DUF1254 domain-containing protein [Desulforapulum autotrophicum]|uniref:DUF1254 domain-containing protein n=1 Tax=Desulforapulum autotrophicum TaxID=2296 RepID=UPI000674F619|nr:DUF1254 domain-containing protein [Desulforapulum autotrophicum]
MATSIISSVPSSIAIFFNAVKIDAFGKLCHHKKPTTIEKQNVVRMNRDTLYSNGVFDFDAAPLTINMPDPGQRFMSLQVIFQDHYTVDVVYAPGLQAYTREKVGTRYAYHIFRTLADPQNLDDLKAANTLQDAIKVE